MTERTLCPIVVGRDAELATLEDALIDAARADGRFVVIAGDAGMGKTRLTNEIQGRAARLGFMALRGGCAPMDVAIPYLPLLEAAGNALARSDVERVRRWVGAAATELGSLFPQLAQDEHLQTGNSGGEGALRLFESVVLLLSALGDGGPMLLIIEDLQWSDPATRDLVDYMARRAPSLPLLVLATYRSDELHRRHPLRSTVHGWRRGSLAEFVELAPLRRADVGVMSRAILDDDVSDEFRDYIHERTEGSPLALEEMLREAIDRGDIFRSARGWDRKPLTQLRIPRAVEEVVLLRLDRLDKRKTSVLNAASVVGRTFNYSVLAAITDMPDATVRAALDELVKDQMLEPDSEVRARFRFRHALIQEAVYDQILSPHREELHLRVAEVLRDAKASDVEVGSHLLRGGRIEDAVPVLLIAADEAMTNFAARTAVEVYQRVLPHVGDPVLRGRVLCRLGESLWRSSEPSAAERVLREAITVVAPGIDTALAARCRHLLGACLHDLGRTDEEEAEYKTALAMLEPLDPGEDLAMVYLRLARLRWSRCDDEGTIDMARNAIRVAEQANVDAVRIWAGAYLGAATVDRGPADEGLSVLQRCCDEALARQMHWIAAAALRLEMDVLIRALRYGDVPDLLSKLRAVPGMSPADEAVAECIAATVAFDQGDIARCVLLVGDAQRLAHRAGQEHIAEGARLLRAAAHLAADELPMARSLLPPIDSVSPAILEVLLPIAVTLDLAEGDPDAAAVKAQRAFDRLSGTQIGAIVSDAGVSALVGANRIDDAQRVVASVHHFAGAARQPYLERAQGAIALALSRPGEAISTLDGASATFAGAGARWEELRTRMLLARAHAAAGASDAAAAELAVISGDAVEAGMALIARAARTLHGALRLPGPAPPEVRPAATAAVRRSSQPSGHTITVVADAAGATNDRWWEWADHEAQRLHGAVVRRPGALTAAFDLEGVDDTWTRALRFALGLRDMGALLGRPVSAGVAAVAADASRLLAVATSNDILAGGEISGHARAWLEARHLVDTETAPAGALRLRSRVATLPARVAASDDSPAPAPTPNEFVLEGDFWSVTYGGTTVRLKDTKGFHDIARLMSTNRAEVAAVDLIGARTPSVGSVRAIADLGFGIEGDAGSVIDTEAREQYRQRLRDLETELEEAAVAHDPVREERARDEREFLLAELRASVGLHGRARRSVDPAERARKAVTWRIRDAIARAEAAHPAFGRHLRRSVRTGTLCAYDPPEPTVWTLVRRVAPSP